MKSIYLKVLGLMFVIQTLMPSTANAMWSILGGVDSYSLSASTGSSNSAFAPQVGIGLYHSSFEVDALYTMKNVGGDTTWKSINVPIFYRFPMMSPIKVGLGAFADYSLTDLPELKKLDYGLAGSVQFHAHLSGSTSFLIDARYLFGLADQTGAHSRELGILVGLAFR